MSNIKWRWWVWTIAALPTMQFEKESDILQVYEWTRYSMYG